MTDGTVVALLGMSPGVVTGALFGLLQSDRRPSALVVLTTADAIRSLAADWNWVAGEPGDDIEVYGAAIIKGLVSLMRRDHPELELSESLPIRVSIPRIGASYLGSIRSTDDASEFQSLLWKEVRALKQRGERIFGGLAGGRKSLAADLQLCFSLACDPDDLLFHLFVPDEYERWWFLYPGQTLVASRMPGALRDRLLGRDPSAIIEASNAKLFLYEVGFIPLRGIVGALTEGATIREIRERARRGLAARSQMPLVEIRLNPPTVSIGGHLLPLSPRAAPGVVGFLALGSRAKLEGCVRQDQPTCQHCSDCYVSAEGLVADWEAIRDGEEPESDFAHALRLDRIASKFLGEGEIQSSRIQMPLAAYAPEIRGSKAYRAKLPANAKEALRKRRQNQRAQLHEAVEALVKLHAELATCQEALERQLDIGVGESAVGIALDKNLVRFADFATKHA